MATWTGQGKGKFTAPGKVSFRGSTFLRTPSTSQGGKLSSLNNMVGVFEYEVDGTGSCFTKSWSGSECRETREDSTKGKCTKPQLSSTFLQYVVLGIKSRLCSIFYYDYEVLFPICEPTDNSPCAFVSLPYSKSIIFCIDRLLSNPFVVLPFQEHVPYLLTEIFSVNLTV